MKPEHRSHPSPRPSRQREGGESPSVVRLAGRQMRVPQALPEAVCRGVAVKVKPLRGGLAADLDSAAAARIPTRRSSPH